MMGRVNIICIILILLNGTFAGRYEHRRTHSQQPLSSEGCCANLRFFRQKLANDIVELNGKNRELQQEIRNMLATLNIINSNQEKSWLHLSEWMDHANLRAGPPGLQGDRGEPGFIGSIGLPGPTGDPGCSGHPGKPGHLGRPGFPGSPGPAGPVGKPGQQGLTGRTCYVPGPPGLAGSQGPSGPAGPPGPIEPRGPTGIEGPKGAQGGLYHENHFFITKTRIAVKTAVKLLCQVTLKGKNIVPTPPTIGRKICRMIKL